MDGDGQVPEGIRRASGHNEPLGEVLEDADVRKLAGELRSGGISRAGFLRRAGVLGLGVGATSSLLAACGGGDKTAADAASTTSTTAPAAGRGGSIADTYKGKTIGVVHLTSADENEATLVKALKEASDKAGLKWTYKEADSQGDQGKAQAAVGSFITQKVDAIVLCVVNTRLVAKQLADAKAAKIPVFGEWTFSELDPAIVVDYTSVPAADASALAGYMFSDLYARKPTGDIKIALVNTDLDILSPRDQTVRAISKLYPRAKIVDSGNISLTDVIGSATNITNGFLSKYGDLDALWTNYPPTGPAAAGAVTARNKAQQVGVYTHVAQSSGIKALADPKSPLRGMPWLDFDWQSYHLTGEMLNHFAGRPVDRLKSYQLMVPFQVFTKETAKDGLTGKGVAAGIGWTLLDGIWKEPLVDSWKASFSA
jgi:ribose transport system substrate-binding protein